MKKILSFTVATVAVFLSLNLVSQTTCSINPTFNKAGIFPDSATNFLSGTVGVPYFQNITVKIGKDTSAGPLTFCFTRFELSNPGTYTNFNLPPGLSLTAGPTMTTSGSLIKIPAQAASCAYISGTPTTAGTYTLQLQVKAFGSPLLSGSCATPPNYNGGTAINTSTLSYYIIQINPVTSGINEVINESALNLTSKPNPFNTEAKILFNVNDELSASIKIKNMLGQTIDEKQIKTKVGQNIVEFDSNNWKEGIYLYTVSYKGHSITKKMIKTL
ncbi:MAG: T9SS type A sorting domain-containing protein [Bacteroidetes bacterium]|nr:T9SS type A sorting domain-containing protein [Bacteroidota bacterium]